jgi:L-2-hydroxyglutarate oxidase
VLGSSRENQSKWSFNGSDIGTMLGFPGFWRLIAANWRTGTDEFRNSIFKRGYLAQCRKYYPALELADLHPFPAGIRAQAVRRDGTMVDDFLMIEGERMVHVCNAPSPAATSALPIADVIADRIAGKRTALSPRVG